MYSLREAIVEVINDIGIRLARFHIDKGRLQTPANEELARAVMDYGRLRLDVRSQQRVIVEIQELAFRFRETRRKVMAALFLLETQGRAKPVKDPRQWQLHF